MTVADGAAFSLANRIGEAASRIPPEFRDSPQFVSDGLSLLAGSPVVVKVETVNPLGCFKGRGSWLCLADLAERGVLNERRGVIAVSSGNFGQGVSYAARAFGTKATIVARARANPTKLERIRRLGATLVLLDGEADLFAEAERLAADGNFELVVDGRDQSTVIGAGTLATEIVAATERGVLPELEAIYVPVGDGALINGIGTWFKHRGRATRVIGVQSSSAPAVARSWRERRVLSAPTTDAIADGIDIPRPHEQSLALMVEVADDVQLVDDAELRDAQGELSTELGIGVELAASAGWAALRRTRRDRPAGVVITGSNRHPEPVFREP
jgi:threonine dehydratase